MSELVSSPGDKIDALGNFDFVIGGNFVRRLQDFLAVDSYPQSSNVRSGGTPRPRKVTDYQLMF